MMIMNYPENVDFSKAKKGDKVYCILHGPGKIALIIPGELFPIRVDFYNRNFMNIGYTYSGRVQISTYMSSTLPILFYSKINTVQMPVSKLKKLIGRIFIKISKQYFNSK